MDRTDPFQISAHEGNIEEVCRLVQSEASIDNQCGMLGTALQAAAAGGDGENQELVKYLIDAGSNVNSRGGLYGSQLYAALKNGNFSVMSLSLEAY
jgi:ankyrin repeat protein